MDNEEFEQIPWSSLMTDKAQGVDPKVYIAVGVVGLVVAVIFGARIFGGSSTQPVPPGDAPAAPGPVAAVTTTMAGLVVSEADLMAGPTAGAADASSLQAVAFAEWFVTDYFTLDGSSENERSLRALLSPTASTLLLPQSSDTPVPTTYVEWARSVTVRDIGDATVEVEVVYRTITETDEGFVRDPVSAVMVTVRSDQTDAGITGLPVPIDVPMPGTHTVASGVPGSEDE
jgi:hypothetical protein